MYNYGRRIGDCYDTDTNNRYNTCKKDIRK